MRKLLFKTAAAATAFVSAAGAGAFTAYASSEPTLAENMAQAGRNTIISIVIVFCILLVLSLIISLFKFIAPKKKTKAPQKTEFVNVAKPASEVSEDEELIAVIMAAIAASEGEAVSPYSYRLKSIKRVKVPRRWNRAR